jgi:hypothetical protein
VDLPEDVNRIPIRNTTKSSSMAAVIRPETMSDMVGYGHARQPV